MRRAFDHANTELYSAFDENLVHNAPLDDMVDPMYSNDMDDEEAHDDKIQNAAVISVPEEFINAKIYLPHGDQNEIARVLGQKRNSDGLYIGRKHDNPILDSQIFTVEFPDGDQQDVAFNILAEHLYSQVDSEGKQYRYFVAIINHRKNTKAVDKVDQFRTHYGKKTTTGWNLEVEWKDGTTSWLPLKEIKETNPVEVANYAISNRIDTEPAFN